ncbi:hypothetical protein BH11MYX3_BH11MYX3_08960 [soil metagenome]
MGVRCLALVLILGGVAAADVHVHVPVSVPSPVPVPVPVPDPSTPPPAPSPAPTPAPRPVTAAPPAPTPEPPPPPTQREKEALASYEPSSVQLGGYLQPQFRMRQDSPAQADQDGFRFARARLSGRAETRAGNLELSAYIEAELQPQFSLADAYATVARTFAVSGHRRSLPGKISLDAGQMRVPVSRQNMLSDSRLSFVDKAQLATISPERDLGARLTIAPPKAPVRLFAGMFNGHGRNQVENINQSYLYAARFELSPVGRDVALAESAFGGSFITIAMSYAHNKLTAGIGRELVTTFGGDFGFAWKGLSGSFEYLTVKHEFDGAADATMQPYKANGWTAQLAYLLPVELAPLKQARLELAFRVEEIDRNDSVPIAQLGDKDQSVRAMTGVLSYYLRMHNLKAQLAVNHFIELEDRNSLGGNAAYDNDQVLLQATYRLE